MKKNMSKKSDVSSRTKAFEEKNDAACCGGGGCSGGCGCKKGKMSGNCGGCAYGLGAIGAAVYYVGVAGTFWGGVLGVLKALVWPAFIVYEVLRYVIG